MLNTITIMGRLTRDPELRRTSSGIPVASFAVAVDRDFTSGDDKVTDFFDCQAWRQGGEFIAQHFHKGDMIVVSGSMHQRHWTDKENNSRTSWELNVERSYFGQPKAKEEAAPAPGPGGYGKTNYKSKRY